MSNVQKVTDHREWPWIYGRDIFEDGTVTPWSRLEPDYVPGQKMHAADVTYLDDKGTPCARGYVWRKGGAQKPKMFAHISERDDPVLRTGPLFTVLAAAALRGRIEK